MTTRTHATRLPGIKPLIGDLNRNKVARSLGINRSSFCSIISGRRGASTEVAQKIADYFGTTVKELMTAPEEVAAK